MQTRDDLGESSATITQPCQLWIVNGVTAARAPSSPNADNDDGGAANQCRSKATICRATVNTVNGCGHVEDTRMLVSSAGGAGGAGAAVAAAANEVRNRPSVIVLCRFGEEVRIPRAALNEDMLTEYARRLGTDCWRSNGMALSTSQPFHAVEAVSRLIRDLKADISDSNIVDIYVAAQELQVSKVICELEQQLADRLDKLSTPQLANVDVAVFERVMRRNLAATRKYASVATSRSESHLKIKGGSGTCWRWTRVLFRWWKADLGRRRDDFTRLAEQLLIYADEASSESDSSERDNDAVLERVEIPRKDSAGRQNAGPKSSPQGKRVVAIAGRLWEAELEDEICMAVKLCENLLLQVDPAAAASPAAAVGVGVGHVTNKQVQATVLTPGHSTTGHGGLPPNLTDNRRVQAADISERGVMRCFGAQDSAAKLAGRRVWAVFYHRGSTILWLDDGSFRMTLGHASSETLEACPEELLEELRLTGLPAPPHGDWLARMSTGGGGCVLLYYPCWGLFLRRPNEAESWKILSEDIFVEYLSPIPTASNAFYILAWKGYSLQAYRTGDLSQTCYTFIREMDARISGTYNRRYQVVNELSWGENVLLFVRCSNENRVYFERHNVLKEDSLVAFVSTKYFNKVTRAHLMI